MIVGSRGDRPEKEKRGNDGRKRIPMQFRRQTALRSGSGRCKTKEIGTGAGTGSDYRSSLPNDA